MYTTSLAPISTQQITDIKSQVARLELPSSKPSKSKGSSAPYFSYSPNIISLGGSSQVHHHYHGTGASSKKKEEDDKASWGVIGAVAAIVGTFFLGRAINDYDTAKQVHKEVSSLPAKLSLEQYNALHIVLDNISDITNNRLWAIANRVVFVAGASLVVLAALTSGPLALGAFLVFGSLLSGSLRLGLNSLEGGMGKKIEFGLSQLEHAASPSPSDAGFYMPGTFSKAYASA